MAWIEPRGPFKRGGGIAMVRYYKAIDRRSRAQMVAYLTNHYRYSTANSWNQSTSYACNMKIHHLGLNSSITDKLFELLEVEDFADAMHALRCKFAEEHNYRWQAHMNGRSGGYLVLYEGELKPSGYKSFCSSCWQHNYRKASELSGCGRCGMDTMQDFSKPHMQVATFPGRGIDMDEDFDEWSMGDLRWRLELVQVFDRLADDMVRLAIDFAKHYAIQEETFLVEKTRRVLVPSA